ncbi:MAG: hypothetical protein VW831_07755 [Gammaproteobacteria bacterium]
MHVVAEKVAEHRTETLDEIATLTTRNARQFFDLPAPMA